MFSRSRKTKDIEATAYHEAGHAYVAVQMRRAFQYVSIEEDEESLGHVLYHKFSEKFEPEFEEDKKIRPYLEKAIMTGFAGFAAEKVFCNIQKWDGSKHDIKQAYKFASYLCGSNEEEKAYIKWLRIRTENMLRTPFAKAAVPALAKALQKKHKIGSKNARKIIKDALIARVGYQGNSRD